MNLLRRACLIGVNGAFGRIFARKLHAAGLTVCGTDLPSDARPESVLAEFVPGKIGELFVERREWFAGFDLVIFCTPESVVTAHLPAALAIEGPAVFADICSVKSRVAAVVTACAGGRRTPFSYVSLHPMFGPVEDFTGFNLCTVPLAEGAAGPQAEFAALLDGWQAHHIELSAEEHDRLTAWVQAACHFAILGYGAALAASGASWDAMQRISTPTQQLLLSLVARIALSDEATYGQIQKENPFAAGARAEIAAACGRLELLSGGQPDPTFQNLFRYIAGFLAAEGGHLKGLSDRLVELVRQENPPAGPR